LFYGALISTFRAFRHYNFALLISGQILSRIDDSLYQVALAWWVLEKTDSGIIWTNILQEVVPPEKL